MGGRIPDGGAMTSRQSPHALLLTVILAALLVGGCSSAPGSSTSAGISPSSTPSHRATSPAAKPGKTAQPSHTPSRTPKPKPKVTHAATTASSSGQVTISFVDVGQGDGIVIKAGSWAGTIDGGKAGNEGAIAAELSDLGVSRLDMMLATHPDADHIGDLAAVAQEFRPKVAYSDDVGTTQTYGRFIAALRAVHSKIRSVFRGQTLHLGRSRPTC